MILTIDLPEQIKTRLEADAREQGKPVAEIAAERLTELYAEYDAPMEPEAVEIVNAALTNFERGERGILLEDLRDELRAESEERRRKSTTKKVEAA